MSRPVFDNSSHSSGSLVSTLTLSHTMGAGANGVLLVYVSVGGGATVSGVTYAGASMTQLGTKAQGNFTAYLFQKLGPATGANNIVVTNSGIANTELIGFSYTNTKQTSTFGTVATNSGTGNSTNTVTTTDGTNQIAIDANFNDGTATTASASQTVRASDATISAIAGGDINATGANMTLTWTNSGNTLWIQISVAMAGVVATSSAGGLQSLMGVG